MLSTEGVEQREAERHSAGHQAAGGGQVAQAAAEVESRADEGGGISGTAERGRDPAVGV